MYRACKHGPKMLHYCRGSPLPISGLSRVHRVLRLLLYSRAGWPEYGMTEQEILQSHPKAAQLSGLFVLRLP